MILFYVNLHGNPAFSLVYKKVTIYLSVTLSWAKMSPSR